MKDLISMLDVEGEIEGIIDMARDLKARQRGNISHEILKGKSLGMIFEKPSTRTRVSFEVGITQLGGHALYLSPKDLQLGRGETIKDTAKVLSRYLDAIMYRAFDHKLMKELAENATIPVINGLDDLEHPCQVLADLMTIQEHKGALRNLKLAYVGDGNNVCNSLLLGCAMVGMNISVACPDEFKPNSELLEKALEIAEKNDCKVEITDKPSDAVRGADIIYTDVWVSMGDEAERERRLRIFKPYQVNSDLVRNAKSDCIIMHCLPAHRGYEITNEVIDSEQSVVFDQAENRLHAQKAVLVKLINSHFESY